MPEPWYAPLHKALIDAEIVAGHIIAGTIALAGDFWLHYILEKEGDPKAFDVLPWRWVVDIGGILILLSLTLASIAAILQMNARGGRS